ncbi:MAG: DUF2275 domain-containing protein [Geobacteraceae bacterium]|nr:DUF2275 domain-containing protein [Geobacteraceae bacterium]
MEHTEVRRNLSAYIDDAVDPATRETINGHLAGCASCSRALHELEQTLAHLKELPEVEPPPWLTTRIMATVREEAGQKRSFWQKLLLPLHIKLPLEALALLCICVTGFYLARMNESPVAPTEVPVQSPQAQPELKQQPAAIPQTSPEPQAAKKAVPQKPDDRKAEYAPPPPQSTAAPIHPPPAEPRITAPQAPPAAKDWNQPDYGMQQRDAARRYVTEMEAMQKSEGHKAARSMKKSPSPAATMGNDGTFQTYRQEKAEASRPGAADGFSGKAVSLTVADPLKAVESIERAVTDLGGRIIRRSYADDGHLLVVQLEMGALPELTGRLERIGRLTTRPDLSSSVNGKINLTIRW